MLNSQENCICFLDYQAAVGEAREGVGEYRPSPFSLGAYDGVAAQKIAKTGGKG
jgi:hypothetical protein